MLLFGNGGSAADAQHIAAELVVRYKTDRPSIAAISLTTDLPLSTACANDLGFDTLFARQIEALARPVDVAVGFSTSGNSSVLTPNRHELQIACTSECATDNQVVAAAEAKTIRILAKDTDEGEIRADFMVHNLVQAATIAGGRN